MNCPRCKNNRTLFAIERSGIEFDYCSECRGIWLDRGELNKILAISEIEWSKKMTNLDFIDESIYNNAYKKIKEDFENKKNKNFLKELFS